MSNHKEEAEQIISPLKDISWPDVTVNAAIAQVHATLALTEQQRIANLIAFRADLTQMRL